MTIGYSVCKEIKSLQNMHVKDAVKLRKRAEREKTKKFLIEGYRELLRACASGLKMEYLFVSPDLFLGENEEDLIEKIFSMGAEVIFCSSSVFHKISYRDRPDGLLAIAEHIRCRLEDLDGSVKNKGAPFLLVAESIEKPGNLGTILRSADAVGVDGVIVCDRCTDIHNPNVVRASVGTLFTQPVVEAQGNAVFHWLNEHDIMIVAATPSAQMEYTHMDGNRGIAVVVGSEQYGLTDGWMKGACCRVKIPMMGMADSLNVATATSLLLYEVLRQRRCSN